MSFGVAWYGAQSIPLTPELALELAGNRNYFLERPVPFSWIPRTHRLVYAAFSRTKEKSWIYSMDAETGATSTLFEGEQPEVSPDASKLAFLRDPDKSSGLLQIWISGVDGATPFPLTNLSVGASRNGYSRVEFKWSPDSTRILYLTVQYKTYAATVGAPYDDTKHLHNSSAIVYPLPQFARTLIPNASIHIIDVVTRHDDVLLEQANISSITWLQSTEFIYQAMNTGKTAADTSSVVMAYSLTTHEKRILISGFNRHMVYQPLVSRDSDLIAFEADPGEEALYPIRKDLAVYSLQKGKVSLLTRFASVTPGTWSPDQKGIIYVDGPSTQRELRFAGLSGESQALTRGSGVNAVPRFSTDGKLLAWIFTSNTETSLSELLTGAEQS